MAIGHLGTGKGIFGGRQERGGTLELLIPAVLVVDGLLLLRLSRSGGNLPGPGRRTGARRVTPQAVPDEASAGPGPQWPAPATSVVEQLASFRDIGTWLTPGLADGAALPGAL